MTQHTGDSPRATQDGELPPAAESVQPASTVGAQLVGVRVLPSGELEIEMVVSEGPLKGRRARQVIRLDARLVEEASAPPSMMIELDLSEWPSEHLRTLSKWASVSRTLNQAQRLITADSVYREDNYEFCLAELKTLTPVLDTLHRQVRDQLWKIERDRAKHFIATRP